MGWFFYLFWPLLGFVSRTRTDDGGEKRDLFFPESKSGVSPAVVSRQSCYSFRNRQNIPFISLTRKT